MRSSKFKYLFLLVPAMIGLCLSVEAQTKPAISLLLGKARSLEDRGRIDLAAQNWQRVLLVNPNQVEALAGLARFAKEKGDADGLRSYLSRLRQINPKDPAIALIERMHVPTPQERERLNQAGRLTLEHRADEALKIYSEVFGEEPPPGRWLGPFYEAEAASTGGRPKAISQLRRLCAREPDNEMSRLWLAVVLTYDAKTRMEGFHLLESIQDPGATEQARGPWRQAILWEKENPAVLKTLDTYLQRYPDPDLQPLQASLHEEEKRAMADASKERGFQALHRNNLETAETDFEEVLRRSANDPSAIAGLGFVRLNQKKYSEALELFDRARALAPQRSDVREGYETARFWLAMQQGDRAVQQNRADAAVSAYQEALALRPGDSQAVLAIAQAMVRAKRYSEAESGFNQVLGRSPNNPDAIAGLGFVRLNQQKFDDAQRLLANAVKLSPGRKDLEEGYRNAKFWGLMQHAAESLGQNRDAEAIMDFRQALVIRPGAADALLGLAESTERAGNDREAIESYRQLTTVNPGEARGWLGLMRVQNPQEALATVEAIPLATRQQMLQRADYLAELALVHYGANQFLQGDEDLRQALTAAAGSDTEGALNARFRVANLLTDQGKVDRAIEIYQQAVDLHPANAIAWQGLIGAYAQLRRFDAAMAALHTMPPNSYAAASKNANFLNSVAAVYSSAGQCAKAEDLLNQSMGLDRAQGRQPSENAELQLASIWMRQHNYERARQKYRTILDRDRNSVEAWQNYLVVLHDQHADQVVVAEVSRVPSVAYASLEKNPGFLTLLAGAHGALGHNEEVIRLLQQARTLYTLQRQTPPADVDAQLAWAMAGSAKHDHEILQLLATERARQDLTVHQRETIEEIWSIWSVRRAQDAMNSKQPERSIEILVQAQRELPQDRRLPSALGAIYLRLHEYHKALEVYSSWRMADAAAADFKAAVGAALATHNETLANGYLRQGLAAWPADADLLQMAAKQAVTEGRYSEAQSDLQSALTAVRSGTSTKLSARTAGNELRNSADSTSPSSLPTLSGPAPAGCLTSWNRTEPAEGRAKLVNASYVITQQSDAQQSQTNQTSNPQPAPSPQKEQQIQDQIDVVQNRNTPATDFGDTATGRSGDQGLDRLIIEDGLLGDSMTLNNRVRFAVEAHGVYLFSGTPNGQSGLQFGTLPKGAIFDQQTAAGFAGDIQLSTNTFGLDFGTSPQGFPTHSLTGGIRFRPLNGDVTFQFERDNVKDSLLSYAGTTDPGTGTVWGGIVSNKGSLQLNRKTRTNGQYFVAGYSFLQGTNVPNNWNVNASAGTYWQIVKGLSLGLNVAGMHYDRNLSFFSFGQGGYFSPQQYYLASIPVSWFSRHRRFEYEVRAAFGAQYISDDASPVFPTLPLLSPGSFFAGGVHTGPNYDLAVRMAYKVAPHWYFEAFGTANNAQNFATQTVGFTLKYLMHKLPTTTDLHVSSIPDWRGKQPYGLQ